MIFYIWQLTLDNMGYIFDDLEKMLKMSNSELELFLAEAIKNSNKLQKEMLEIEGRCKLQKQIKK